MVAGDTDAEGPWENPEAQRWVELRGLSVDSSSQWFAGLNFERRHRPLLHGEPARDGTIRTWRSWLEHRDTEPSAIELRTRSGSQRMSQPVWIVGDHRRDDWLLFGRP